MSHTDCSTLDTRISANIICFITHIKDSEQYSIHTTVFFSSSGFTLRQKSCACAEELGCSA